MSLLKKIFSSAEKAEPPSHEAPNLTPPPELQVRESPQEKLKKLRAAQIRLSGLHDLSFQQQDPPRSKPVYLTSISLGKIGFLKSSSPQWPEPGGIVKGILKIEGFGSAALGARVENITSRAVDCALVEPSAELEALLKKCFQVEFAAVSMIRVNPKAIKPEKDGTPHWYYGDHRCALFFVLNNEEKLLRFHLSVFSNYFEWKPDQGLKYGLLIDEGGAGMAMYRPTQQVNWQSKVPVEMVELISKFLINISQLPPAHRFAINEIVVKAGQGG